MSVQMEMLKRDAAELELKVLGVLQDERGKLEAELTQKLQAFECKWHVTLEIRHITMNRIGCGKETASLDIEIKL